ncbi:hypothetical protein CYY_002547 [Polysphondylium violaceum]|uniref:Transmembrane protein n=1 Tax=Polysphondylium violaceum TaxID=133409 RepID=A0A8J4V0R7_9MYCE|nr:hypothetical protein CYY_002547 [Polysphondylium violaceum]
MYKTILFLLLALLNLYGIYSSSDHVPILYVNPQSKNTKIDCGKSITSSCNSITSAVNSFINNSTVYNQDEILPPLIIELMPGEYYPSNTTFLQCLSIPLYKFNITIQGYKNQEIKISGKHLIGEGPFFWFEPSSFDKFKKIPTLVNVRNIEFQDFPLPIVNSNLFAPLAISFMNVNFTNSFINVPYPDQLFIIFSSSKNQSVLQFHNCMFSNNNNILLSQGAYVQFINTTITNTKSLYPILSFPYSYPSIPNTLVFENCLFQNNQATNHGLIYSIQGKIILENSILKNNVADSIINCFNSIISSSSTSFISNIAIKDNIINIKNNSLLEVNKCIFSLNQGSLGTIGSIDSDVFIGESTFKNDFCKQSIISQSGGVLKIQESSFFFNLIDVANLYHFENVFQLLENTRVLMNNTSVVIKEHHESSVVSVIDCKSSFIKFTNTTITSKTPLPSLYCQTCDIENQDNNDGRSIYSCQKPNQSSSDASNSNSRNDNHSHSSHSGHSSNNHPKKSSTKHMAFAANTVLYVSPAGKTAAQCGATIATACPTIKDAVSVFAGGKGPLIVKLINGQTYGATDLSGIQLYGLDITIQPNDENSTITITGDQSTTSFFNIANNGADATSVTVDSIVFDKFSNAILTATNIKSQLIASFNDCVFSGATSKSDLIQVSSSAPQGVVVSVSLSKVQITNNDASVATISSAALNILDSNIESNTAVSADLITLTSSQATLINSNVSSNVANVANLISSSITTNNTYFIANIGGSISTVFNSFESTVTINQCSLLNNVGIVINSQNSSTLVINNSVFDYDYSASLSNAPNDMLNLTNSYAQIDNSSFSITGQKISDLITVINCETKSDIVFNHMPVAIDLGYEVPALCISRTCNMTNTNHTADPFYCVVAMDPKVRNKAISFIIGLSIMGAFSLVIVGLICARREILNRKDAKEDQDEQERQGLLKGVNH